MMIITLSLVFLGAFARLLPHPANFAPIGAIALFAGLYLPRRLSLVAPVSAMLISDIVIGFYDLRIMAAVYMSFLISIALGRMIKKNKSTAAVVGGTALGAVVFFLFTNAAVWAFGTMYPQTLHGLGESYLMAIPFFRNSLLGDLFFTGVLVGGMELIHYYRERLSESATASV